MYECESGVWRPLLDDKLSSGGRTEIVGTAFLSEASIGLDMDSGSSLALSFSLLSSTEESRSILDREDCGRHRTGA